jgi:hypothetical protein
MQKNLTDDSWAALYPLFGFLIGRCIGSAAIRHQSFFDGDIEAMFTFYKLGELNAARHHSPGNIQRLIQGTMPLSEYAGIELEPVSALSLAAVMRRPRESTRRRLKKLVQLGMAEVCVQAGKRGYVISRKSIEHFYHDDRILYEDLVKLVEVVDRFQGNVRS